MSWLLILNILLIYRPSSAQEKFELQLDPRWGETAQNAPYIQPPKKPEKPNWWARAGWGLLGALTAYQVHELGHYLIAEARGLDAHYHGFSVNVDLSGDRQTGELDERGKRDAKIFAVSGFIAQGATAQLLLAMDFVPKNNAFVIGYISLASFVPLYYVFRHETTGYSSGKDDFLLYEKAGGNVRLVEGIVVANSILLALELLTHRDFWTYVGPQDNGAMVGVGKKF